MVGDKKYDEDHIPRLPGGLPIYWKLDENKIPVAATRGEAEKIFRNPDLKIIKQDLVNGYLVSTAFLVLDYTFTVRLENVDTYKPTVFETMILDTAKLWRCCEYREALEWHNIAVATAKALPFNRDQGTDDGN